MARGRRFSGADKQRILETADRCVDSGEVGALLRHEAIYSSQLSTWREQRRKAQREALTPQRRGPKPDLALAGKTARRSTDARDCAFARRARASAYHHRCPKQTLHLAWASDGARERRGHLMDAFHRLQPSAGIASACTALGINRADIYRQRAGNARHGATRCRDREAGR